jgi:thiamine-phosphate pyrophosphorylase
MVQLREKDLPAGELLSLALRLREITSGKALLLINDRVDVALASDADGVQLGEQSLHPEAVRRVAGNELLIGRSVHNVNGACQAESEGADFLIVGTIYPTQSHPDADVAGTGLLKQVGQHVHIPFLAIGGVDKSNIRAVIENGASGAAVITAITGSPDPALSSRTLMEKIEATWASKEPGATRTA